MAGGWTRIVARRHSGDMTATRTRWAAWAAAVLLHLAVTAVVWRDIDERGGVRLRGSRTLWRVLTAANSGNSLLYLLVGRR